MSAAAKGKPKTPEHTAKVAAANRGTKRSEETKRKIGLAHKNPSEETRKKMRESHLGKPRSLSSIENFKKTWEQKRVEHDKLIGQMNLLEFG